MKKATFLVAAVASLLMAGAIHARSPLSMESTYLGGGWFRYTVGVVDDPFFEFLDVNGFLLSHPSIVERGPNPTGWTNNPAAGFWGFAGASPGVQTLPYRASFLVRSSETHFKRGDIATLSMTFSTIGGYHGLPASGIVGGFWYPPVLIPCPANEADGSSTNLLVTCDSLTLLDIRITGLQRTGETIHGLSYEFSAENTVRLEGSRDLARWTNVAYIHGVSNVTTWTTNRALNDFGNFFRLRLIDYGHITNLPPLSAVGRSSPAVPSATVQLENALANRQSLHYEFVQLQGDQHRPNEAENRVNPFPARDPSEEAVSLGFFHNIRVLKIFRRSPELLLFVQWPAV